MNEENMVSLSLKYYDKQREKHRQYYSDEYRLVLNHDGTDVDFPTFDFFDKGNKSVLHGVYNILGFYFKEERMWCWGWGLSSPVKSSVYLSRKILNYGLDSIVDFGKENRNKFFLNISTRTDLLSSRIDIEHPIQLEQYLAIGQYVTKCDMVYKLDDYPEYGSNVSAYLILKYTDL